MNELWVARDWDGSLWEYGSKPVWRESTKDFTSAIDECGLTRMIPAPMYSDLKPGECRRLVMESEVSE